MADIGKVKEVRIITPRPIPNVKPKPKPIHVTNWPVKKPVPVSKPK